MFSIIGHSAQIAYFRDAIQRGELAPALHFTGPPLVGKLSMALDIARIMNCVEQRERGCACRSCNQFARRSHPVVALLGKRYCIEEIAQYMHIFRTTPTNDTLESLIGAINILIRRFDQYWFAIEEHAKKAHIIDSIASIHELLAGVTQRDATKQGIVKDYIPRFEDIEKICADLDALYPSHISFNSLRHVSHWAHRPFVGSDVAYKCIIIENSETLGARSFNLLLKLLEEPPQRVIIMMLSTNPHAVPATIRSRLQEHIFTQRTADEQKEVMRTYLHIPDPPNSLHTLFFGDDEIVREGRAIAHDLLDALGNAADMLRLTERLFAYLDNRTHPHRVTSCLLESIMDAFHHNWRRDPTPEQTQLCSEVCRLLQTIHYRYRQLNIQITDQLVMLISGINTLHAAFS